MLKKSENIEKEEIFTLRRHLALWGLLNFFGPFLIPVLSLTQWEDDGVKNIEMVPSLSQERNDIGSCRRNPY